METSNSIPPLHTSKFARRTFINHVFGVVYTCAILSLLYHHIFKLIHSTSVFISLSMLVADIVLAFMWVTAQPFRMRPLIRQTFPQNLHKVVQPDDFPNIDIFICTADPYKEPPMNVVNTALSVMAYDYPKDKISVYVSDDGGSDLTLFAFMEAAKFAKHWLPFCEQNNTLHRSPDVFFRSSYYPTSSQTEDIKVMYECMKSRVENVVKEGKVSKNNITGEQEQQAFNKWAHGFTRQHHPSVIQVLLETGKDKDIREQSLPNLIYVSREKSATSPHHFKAGALNALLRVSAAMTNAPIILTLDCDMYSNDPETPNRVLCYFLDPSMPPDLGFVQFPQCFHGLNKADIYASEHIRLFILNAIGMDGMAGPPYVGTGCFFRRRCFFGDPTLFVSPEIPELSPDHVVNKLIHTEQVSVLAHHVAGCTYENDTWGSKIGFRYGSLVEDYYTGYRLQCEGWKSIFCNPERPAFLGDIPITLNDVLSQTKRWSIGLLEVTFSKYSPLTFGTLSAGPFVGLSFAHYGFWPIWCIPISIYAFLPQVALLNKVTIFPKVTDAWFMVYTFLFVGAYGQDCMDFILAQGSFKRWWSDQRMWLIRGLSSFLYGFTEFITTHLGIPSQGFNVTNKLLEDEQIKRYDQGTFEFGLPSSMFVPLVAAATINLISFSFGCMQVFTGSKVDELLVQMFIASFGMLNSFPIYKAMGLRRDRGRIPTKITIIGVFMTWTLYATLSHALQL